jgi:hypothetical protein
MKWGLATATWIACAGQRARLFVTGVSTHTIQFER